MSQKSRLLVVIVNYKSPRLVCQTLEALLPQLDPEVDHVTVVDNDSKGDSIAVLNEYLSQNQCGQFVDLIQSNINGGFSFGNNLGIRPALEDESQTPEFILLLNPDTLSKPDAIITLLNFMTSHPKAGIAGSRLEGEDGSIQCSSFRFHTVWSELDSAVRFGSLSKLLSGWKVAPEIPNQAVKTDWVAGASMLIRTDVIRDVGLMDEDYFLYFEETDFCLQAARQGWECWYVPDSRVIHYVGQSTGVVSGGKDRARKPVYWFEARQHYFLKNHGILYTISADLLWGIGFAVWRLRRLIQKKPDTDPENMLVDFWKNSFLCNFVRKRFSK